MNWWHKYKNYSNSLIIGLLISLFLSIIIPCIISPYFSYTLSIPTKKESSRSLKVNSSFFEKDLPQKWQLKHYPDIQLSFSQFNKNAEIILKSNQDLPKEPLRLQIKEISYWSLILGKKSA